MKLKHILAIVAFSTTFVASGCVDIFSNSETLVFGYTDEPWILRTKATEPARSFDMYYISDYITGNKEWEDIDHLIYMDLASRRFRGNVYDANTNADMFSILCRKHGDTEKSPVGAFCAHSSDPAKLHFFQDFTALEVTCEEDFDLSHPAGSSLLDIIHYATDTPFRVLTNNYQLDFNDNSLIVLVSDYMFLSEYYEYYGDKPVYRQVFNTFKKGTDVKPEDLTILGSIYISFDILPDVIEPKHITIQMTADDGKVYDFKTVLTFERVKGSPPPTPYESLLQ